MSYMVAAPEMLTGAAGDVASIGSAVNAAHMAASAPTVAVLPAAADEVSAGIARVFSQHAQGYHALAGHAAAFQDQFVQQLSASAASYASTEAASVSGFLTFLSDAWMTGLEAIAVGFGGATPSSLIFWAYTTLFLATLPLTVSPYWLFFY